MNNSLLAGASASQLQKLQRIQNAMARLICRSKQQEHITPVLKSLHWLPIHMGLIFRLLLLVFKALHNAGPVCLRDWLHVYQPRRSLRSSSQGLLLEIPSSRLKSCGDRSFSYASSTEWNKLPLEVRSRCTVSSFKSALTTFFFMDYFTDWLALFTVSLHVYWRLRDMCRWLCVCVCVRDTQYMSVRAWNECFFKCALEHSKWDYAMSGAEILHLNLLIYWLLSVRHLIFCCSVINLHYQITEMMLTKTKSKNKETKQHKSANSATVWAA